MMLMPMMVISDALGRKVFADKMHPTLELVHAHQSFPVENLLWDDLGGEQEVETFIC